MPRPKTHDDALRVRLLDRASELLSTEGPAGLNLRRLAADVGTSTTAVYSLFGGKPALVRALYLEALQRFGARLNMVPDTGDPGEDLIQLGLAYRRGALAEPHLYSAMFNTADTDFEPDDHSTKRRMVALAPLLDVVSRGVEKGRLSDVNARQFVIAASALLHGLVSLELNGNLPVDVEIEPTYERALRANVAGWLT